MNPLIQLRKATPLFLLALACFALSPGTKAVNPPPDGGYPGENTAAGDDALFSLTTGTDNTAIGFDALYSNTTGFNNTAIGAHALQSNTTGNSNTAEGHAALFSNTTGNNNTSVGAFALVVNSSGGDNTAIGTAALGNNYTGFGNTAVGLAALISNRTGNDNTASGQLSLAHNTTADRNTATGAYALYSNITGSANTSVGYCALRRNTTGNQNTANGVNALVANAAGNGNTASGNGALGANTSGSFNTALGFNAGGNLTTGSDNIDIGALGIAGESNTIRIGNVHQTATFIAGISGAVVTGAPVVVNSTGQLGVAPSSGRFKSHIEPMDTKSEAILALKPVTFRYRKDLDPDSVPQFGLVAEDVEKVNPDLVARDADGKPYAVRYEAVNAMLLNEFLEEHRKNEEQEATIARQQKQIEALTVGLQKVSAQLELNKAAPQTVLNSQ